MVDFSVLLSSQGVGNSQITAGMHNILLGLVAVICGLASWGLKLLKDWIDVQVATHTHGLQGMIAKRIVAYVEQKATDAMTNQDKLNQAVGLIQKEIPALSVDEINHLVEEAVNNLKQGTTSPVATTTTDGTTVKP